MTGVDRTPEFAPESSQGPGKVCYARGFDLLPGFSAKLNLVESVSDRRADMKKRFTEAQIIGFLKEAQAGVPVKDLCRKHGFSDAAFYGWRAKFGGMQVDDAKRLRALEAENAKLKKLLAESMLDAEALKAALRGKY